VTVKEALEVLKKLVEKHGDEEITDERSNTMDIVEENGRIRVKKKPSQLGGYQNQPPANI
jgi:hypothetical protein